MTLGPGIRSALLKATPPLGAFIRSCAEGLKAHEDYPEMKKPAKKWEPCDHTHPNTGASTLKEYHAGRHGWYARCQLPSCMMRWKWDAAGLQWIEHPDALSR